jgi:hypothetical protein
MWSTAGSPFSTLRDVASKRTSAWAFFSQIPTLLGEISRAGVPAPHFSGSMPVGSAIQPKRREAMPVTRKLML